MCRLRGAGRDYYCKGPFERSRRPPRTECWAASDPSLGLIRLYRKSQWLAPCMMVCVRVSFMFGTEAFRHGKVRATDQQKPQLGCPQFFIELRVAASSDVYLEGIRWPVQSRGMRAATWARSMPRWRNGRRRRSSTGSAVSVVMPSPCYGGTEKRPIVALCGERCAQRPERATRAPVRWSVKFDGRFVIRPRSRLLSGVLGWSRCRVSAPCVVKVL